MPDEQLRFILDSLLQYVIGAMPSGGNLEIVTKTAIYSGAVEEREFFKKNGKHVEIGIAFTGLKTEVEPSAKESGTPREGVLPDLVYRLVEKIVAMNQGTMEFEMNSKEPKNVIFLRLPVERRKLVYYRHANE